MNFNWFKQSAPAITVFRRLGLEDLLKNATDWETLHRSLLLFNNRDLELRARAEEAFESLSAAERVLLCTILATADFAGMADTVCGGFSWEAMNRISGDHRRAVAACIACVDSHEYGSTSLQ